MIKQKKAVLKRIPTRDLINNPAFRDRGKYGVRCSESPLTEINRDPKVRLRNITQTLNLHARISTVLPLLIGAAESYESKRTTPERYADLEIARTTYEILKTSADIVTDPLVDQALTTFRAAYPELYSEMSKNRRK